MANLILKSGREKSVIRKHPWIFSSAIKQIEGSVKSGESVEIFTVDGTWLARGAYSHHSKITARIWTWDHAEEVDEAFFYQRLFNAVNYRQSLYDIGDSNAFRLVHGESDGIPGLIIDRYDDIAVIQYMSAGPEHWMEEINGILPEVTGVQKLYERSDADVRKIEGLPIRVGPISGERIPEEIAIREHGLIFEVNIRKGHKTGLYLDQRVNRMALRSYAEDKDILDCFCYTGGFSINAWKGNARSILALDESEEALKLAATNQRLNEVTSGLISLQRGDVFQMLRVFRDHGLTFDVIILDPPKFAPTVAQVERATRGYKDINLLAMKLLRENGVLLTFSCSGGVSGDLFRKIIAGAALDSGRDFQIIGHLHQSADHPVAVNFPEGAYLKGLVLRHT